MARRSNDGFVAPPYKENGGYAYVYFNYQDIYLGPWDGKSPLPPDTLAEYTKVLAKCRAEFDARKPAV